MTSDLWSVASPRASLEDRKSWGRTPALQTIAHGGARDGRTARSSDLSSIFGVSVRSGGVVRNPGGIARHEKVLPLLSV